MYIVLYFFIFHFSTTPNLKKVDWGWLVIVYMLIRVYIYMHINKGIYMYIYVHICRGILLTQARPRAVPTQAGLQGHLETQE